MQDAVRLLLLTSQREQKVLGDSSVLIYPNFPQKTKEYPWRCRIWPTPR